MAVMNYDDIAAHFRAKTVPEVITKLNEIGINVTSRQTIYNWINGGVPELVQYKLEDLTRRKLHADRNAA